MKTIPNPAPISSMATPGVYFLYHGEILVYVGQSSSVQRRINEHLQQKVIRFDRCSFIYIPDLADRLRQEQEFIKTMRPAVNYRRPTGGRVLFNVRVTPLLKQQIQSAAGRLGITVSQFVCDAAREKIRVLRATHPAYTDGIGAAKA